MCIYMYTYIIIYIYICMYQIISVSSGPNPPETHQSANPVAHPVSGLIFAAPALFFHFQLIDFSGNHGGSMGEALPFGLLGITHLL